MSPAPTRARPASAARSNCLQSCGPSRSGCSRGTHRGALPSTICLSPAPALAVRPRAPARAHPVAPRRRSSGARCARRHESRASLRSSASRSGRSRPAWRAPRGRRRGSAPMRRPAPAPGRRAARPDDRDRRRARGAGAARDMRGSPSTRARRHRAAPLLPRCGRRKAQRNNVDPRGRDVGARF